MNTILCQISFIVKLIPGLTPGEEHTHSNCSTISIFQKKKSDSNQHSLVRIEIVLYFKDILLKQLSPIFNFKE